MQVLFLGTGAASGWPNPYCSCDSCQQERAAGRARSTTSVLIDEQILLDCGPAALDGARALHQSLAAVQHVVITHGHPDHLAPAFLLFRHWAHGKADGPMPALHVWAPPQALESCQPWIAPQDLGLTVHLHPLLAGDQHTLSTADAEYTLRVLPAAHDAASANDQPADLLASEAVLLDLEDHHGVRVLYATDTGPLTPVALTMVSERDYHLACIEETFGDHLDHHTGHLDLRTFPATIKQLRSSRAITDRTQVVAIHLGHHNPPTPRLREVLAPMGVEVVDDGTRLNITTEHINHHAASVHRSANTHLVLGGARSGKSRYAEALATAFDSVLYVACARQDPDDAEWTERIRTHRERRPAHWRTVESVELANVISTQQADSSCILIDCLGTWVTALVDDAAAWQDRQRAQQVVTDACADLRSALTAATSAVILVSNEVGSGVVPSSASGRLFRDLLGVVNLQVAQACDDVTVMVAGRPMALGNVAQESP